MSGPHWTPPPHAPTRCAATFAQEVKAKRDQDLVVLPTDAAVFEDDGFRTYAEKYAADQDVFFTVGGAGGGGGVQAAARRVPLGVCRRRQRNRLNLAPLAAQDYVASHLKLSEQGAKWMEGTKVTLE